MSEYIVRETGFPGTIKQEIVGELVRCEDCECWDRDTFECEKAYENMTGDIEGVKYETWHDHFCADGRRRDG